jgi:hypothetical protein
MNGITSSGGMNTPRDARRSGGMNTVLPSTMALIPFTNRRDNAKASGAPLEGTSPVRLVE